MLQRILASAAVLAFVALPAAAQAKHKAGASAKQISFTGHVIDMNCYTTKGAMGPAHKECAVACAKAGVPLAILAHDGTIYLPVSSKPGDPQNPRLLPFAEQNVKVTGRTRFAHGVHTIEIASITAAT
jgi:predicted lipoprotein with Yx(FWY)xxD motif